MGRSEENASVVDPGRSMTTIKYEVSVYLPGFGRYQGGSYIISRSFRDRAKARDFYTDCLVRYPDNEVEFKTIEN